MRTVVAKQSPLVSLGIIASIEVYQPQAQHLTYTFQKKALSLYNKVII